MCKTSSEVQLAGFLRYQRGEAYYIIYLFKVKTRLFEWKQGNLCLLLISTGNACSRSFNISISKGAGLAVDYAGEHGIISRIPFYSKKKLF